MCTSAYAHEASTHKHRRNTSALALRMCLQLSVTFVLHSPSCAEQLRDSGTAITQLHPATADIKGKIFEHAVKCVDIGECCLSGLLHPNCAGLSGCLHRLSDTKLVLVYSARGVPVLEGPPNSNPAVHPGIPVEGSASNFFGIRSGNSAPTLPNPPISTPRRSHKRKLVVSDSSEEDETAEDIEIHIPAHKFILIALSQYFSTRLETAVGQSPTAILKLFAGSVDELYAMEAVVEHIYADKDKLPVYCTADVAPAREVQSASLSHMKRLLTTLMVGGSKVRFRWRSKCEVVVILAQPSVLWCAS